MFAGDPVFDVVGEAADGAEAVELAERPIPTSILMDLRMPGVNGAAAIRRARRAAIPSRVLVLTTYDSDADVVPALEAGATGYLLKDSPRAGAVPRGARGGAGRVRARAVRRDAADEPAPAPGPGRP